MIGRSAKASQQFHVDLRSAADDRAHLAPDAVAEFGRIAAMLDARGMMLPLWDDVLPSAADADLVIAAERVGATLNAMPGPALARRDSQT
jgi:hypothetical protein